MKHNNTIEKYLTTYAEDFSTWLTTFPRSVSFSRCAVIPAYDESSDFTHEVSKAAPTDTLFIVILNCPSHSTPQKTKRTQHIQKHLQGLGSTIWSSPQGSDLQLLSVNSSSRQHYWLLWDITDWQDSSNSEKTPKDNQPSGFVHGVGYARKLGMDCALWLYHRQHINTPYLFSTDADAQLPPGYFTLPSESNPTMAGYIFPFQHKSPLQHDTNQEALLYEASIRYYVLGLRWAKSPWGFQTVGSTLAIHPYHYAANRGFPKRDAGEDFYLLNKLAKTGAILSLKEPSITLSDRASSRVPFGTGPAIQRLQQLEDITKNFFLYHPSCFVLLHHWMHILPSLFTTHLHQAITSQAHNDAPKLLCIVDKLNVTKAIRHSQKQSKNEQDFLRHMLTWFDAFRTLKFIHHARDEFYPSVPLIIWNQMIEDNQVPPIPPRYLHNHQSGEEDTSQMIHNLSVHIHHLEIDSLPYLSNISR